MGAGMVIGGVLALAIAATKVVLPYDEAFLGMSINDLTAINPRLLAFMAHDRVTLAGVMVAIGLLYVVLSRVRYTTRIALGAAVSLDLCIHWLR